MKRAGKIVASAAAAGVAAVGVITMVSIVLIVLLIGSLTFDGCEWDVRSNPGTGADSQELPVEVSPTDGLADGATVLVSSQAFRGNGIIGVAVCLEEALTEERGVEACDTDAGQRFATTPEGELAAIVAVPRVITVDGAPHDCAERAGRCLVVAADSQDFDLSGGQPVTFAADLGPADLVPGGERSRSVLLPGSVTPAGPVAAGTTVTAEASGFMPGEPVLVGRCTAAFLQSEIWDACAPADGDVTEAVDAILGRSVDQVELHADGDGAVRVEFEVSSRVAPGISGDQGGGVDCADEPGACAIVIAAAADTQRSAYLPLTLTG